MMLNKNTLFIPPKGQCILGDTNIKNVNLYCLCPNKMENSNKLIFQCIYMGLPFLGSKGKFYQKYIKAVL